MKNIFSNVMLVAAAAMAFFSCQKQEIATPEISGEVMLSFVSEKPSFVDETKTEWTGETVQWSKGDKISIAYTVDGNWQNASGNADSNAKLYKSDELGQASQTAKFNVSTYFEGTTEGVHVFYGVYPAPSETGFAGAPVASISVAPSQAPKADSFDANGDLMVGISRECSSRPAEGEKISLLWDRLVAHAVITLKEINGLAADEVLEKVTLTAQDGANLVGKQKLNIITKEIVCDNASSNVLTIGTGNLTQQNGSITFWACVLPETITSLNVAVETDKAVYTREITGISKEFMQNARNLLTINMSSAERVLKVVDESSVVDVLTRATTGATTSSYISWSGKTLTSSAVYAGQSAGGNESVQLRSNNNNSGVVTTASGGYAKKVSVIWNSSTSNGRTLNVYGKSSAYNTPSDLYDQGSSGTLLGTIVCGMSTELVIEGKYEYIGMRSASGAMYLGEIKITWSAGEPETPAPEERNLVSISVSDDAKIEYGVGAEFVKPTVTASYDDNSTADVTASATFSGYDMNTTGTHTVTVSYAENDVTATTTYTITVSENEEPDGPTDITVADFLELKNTATEYILTGKITRVANESYGNFDLTDATGTVYVYGLLTPDGVDQKQWAAAGLKQGDIITVKGIYNEYNGSSQIKNAVYVSHKGISVDKTSYTFAAEGGSFEVTATLVNASDAVSVSVDNPHFNVALKSGTTYTVTAPANQTEEDIYANLTFTAGELSALVSITQTAPVPEDEIIGGRDDFNTVNANTSYNSYKTTAGWQATNSAVLQGGSTDSNPTYKFIGSTSATRAFCMNGKNTAKGTITSPTLTTGCGTLKFNYGLPFSDTKIKFKVEIKQNGAVVKTITIDNSSASKTTKYSHEESVNVSGDFQIVFTNLSPSNSKSNKDRTAIWNIEWTGCN